MRNCAWISLCCGNVALSHAATGLCRSFTSYVNADMHGTLARGTDNKPSVIFTRGGGLTRLAVRIRSFLDVQNLEDVTRRHAPW
jgi:hypothetical protein